MEVRTELRVSKKLGIGPTCLKGLAPSYLGSQGAEGSPGVSWQLEPNKVWLHPESEFNIHQDASEQQFIFMTLSPLI